MKQRRPSTRWYQIRLMRKVSRLELIKPTSHHVLDYCSRKSRETIHKNDTPRQSSIMCKKSWISDIIRHSGTKYRTPQSTLIWWRTQVVDVSPSRAPASDEIGNMRWAFVIQRTERATKQHKMMMSGFLLHGRWDNSAKLFTAVSSGIWTIVFICR